MREGCRPGYRGAHPGYGSANPPASYLLVVRSAARAWRDDAAHRSENHEAPNCGICGLVLRDGAIAAAGCVNLPACAPSGWELSLCMTQEANPPYGSPFQGIARYLSS